MLHRYCLALDLIDDEALIAEYEKWHTQVWPEILTSITSSGIEQMEIYRTGNRLFMIMEVHPDFSFEAKSNSDEFRRIACVGVAVGPDNRWVGSVRTTVLVHDHEGCEDASY